MTTLVYTPGITAVVQTLHDGLVDISDDITDGSLSLVENGSHSLRLTLNNPYRKYDGVFQPNDRIVVQLKRINWLQVFSGLLTSVPLYSTFPRPVRLSADCNLKILRNWPWDAHSIKAFQLIHGQRDREAQDGGISTVISNVLQQVVGWPAEAIHIGAVPSEWYQKFQTIYDGINDESSYAESVLGSNPLIGGSPISAPAAPANIGVVTAEDERIPATYDEIPIILQTIRYVESGNDYKAINNGDGHGDRATGAYQFMTSSWGNYGGYGDAYLAPPSVQDEKATAYVKYILDRYGRLAVNVPYGWYFPKVFNDPTWLDKIPAENEGNNMTIRQYGRKWLGVYKSFYLQARGTEATASAPTSIDVLPHDSSSTALYPIPVGVDRLVASESGWGGYQNGKVPSSAMRYTSRTGLGHPAAIESYTLLLAEADKAGLDLHGSCYRSLEAQQAGAAQSSNFATPGNSNHGWGLAIDIACLVGGSEMYDSRAYDWLSMNAWKFGWGHPTWARQGGSKPEPWHWEFLAFPNFKDSWASAPGSGVNPFDPASGNGIAAINGQDMRQLYSVISMWEGAEDELSLDSLLLVGAKATMNDSPVLETIQGLVSAAGRRFCTAPNGDFIAWWPDFWGEYGTAGRMNVELIELEDFAVDWTDKGMITHQFVEGSFLAQNAGPLPQGLRDPISAVLTRGVATVEIPRLLEQIIKMDTAKYPWLKDPAALLRRFGARIRRTQVSEIAGGAQEFWHAVQLFLDGWASMFSTTVPTTFMPEVFPGMILAIPELGVQFYVTGVNHQWDFTNDVGFTTSIDVIAPSATDGSGFYLLPRAGKPTRGVGRSRVVLS